MASFDNSHGLVRYLRGLSPHVQPEVPPLTFDEYVRAYGVNRHDAFITKYQDCSARDPSTGSFAGLPSEEIVLVLTRAYEQPSRLAENHLKAPHVPYLVAYLFLQVYLPDFSPQVAYSPALVLAKEYSNSFGLFSPVSSPMWTTSTEWHGDKLALIYPRKDIYKLLLQTVQEDSCNETLATKLETWLNDVVKFFPEDENLRHPIVRASHEYLLREHEIGQSQKLRVDTVEEIYSPTPEDLPEWDLDTVLDSASAMGASAPADHHSDDEAELYTRRLRTRSYYNPTK